MSSLRNAVKRVTHKERSQPVARQHLGLLEKKKDYKKRAVDYHRKQDKIVQLKIKAAMRNPDEFYFGMENAQMTNGKHQKKMEVRNKELEHQIGADAVRLMKDQDLSYVRMQKQKDSKKRERLQASLHYLDADSKRKHTIFVESEEQAKDFDVAQHFDTIPELAGRSFNRRRTADIEKELERFDVKEGDLAQKAKIARRQARALARQRKAQYGELEARALRMAVMTKTEAHLMTEKLVAGKGRKRKIKAAEDGQPAQYKWRRQRAK
jgi:U3 small nucleolar RNA-associated protein 11